MDRMEEKCKRCDGIKGLREEPATIVFILENQLLKDKLKRQLANITSKYQEEEDSITIEVSGLRSFFEKFYQTNTFSELEGEDIWIVVLSSGETLKNYYVKNARNLNFWLSQVACSKYIKILEEKRLTVYFHPIVNKDLSVIGFECLIRGIEQDGSLVSPAYLFDCAEKTNSIFYFDRTCREVAIRKSAEKGLKDVLIFINFVPTSIYNPETCLKTTIELADLCNLKHENIVFEVVETHKVEDIKHLRSILDYYREKGFKVALDDVGSGFSGLTNLVNLHPDIIKIDREIIHNINGDDLKQGVVEALVNLCRKNDIKVLAEGVETIGEFNFIFEKVDYMQGFLFAKPSPEPSQQISIKGS